MNSKNIIIYTLILVAGLVIGFLIFGGSGSEDTHDEHDHPTEQVDGEVLYTCSMHPQIREDEAGDCPICGMDLIPVAEPAQDTHEEHSHSTEQVNGEVLYTCSMHPQIREDEPGDCPICGMDLIPVAGSETDQQNTYTLTLTDGAAALADIQSSPVVYEVPEHTYTLPGKVVEDQNMVSGITAHFPGRIRDLYVDVEGTSIQKGQKLASVYSPELIAAQQELLETMKYKEQNPRLYQAARQKLRLWEFPERTIDEIEESGKIMNELDFYSPVSGHVSAVAISREQHVKEGDLMYRVVDLSSVWVDFQAYESNISYIHEGDPVEFSLEAYPGKIFKSAVQFIDPFLNTDSRSVTVRTTLNNPEGGIKPGMMAKATVKSGMSEGKALMIPKSAVMWTGERSIVYVQLTDTNSHTFEAREVMLGHATGDKIVVVSGVSEGEQVVTHGTFKIDSEAQLNDKLSMMNREPGTGATMTGHDHGSMETNESGSTESAEMDHSGHQ